MAISRNVTVFLAVVLLALAGLVAWRALRHAPTDEERIQALVEAIARAVEERKPGAVMEGVSERFQADELDHRALRQLVTYEVLRGSWNAVVPLSTQVTVSGDRAEAVVDAALVRGGQGKGVLGRLPESGETWRFEIGLEREKDGWKVVTGRWRPTGPR